MNGHSNIDVKNCTLFFQQTYTFSLASGQKVQDVVDVSVEGNFVQYHAKNNYARIWVINDFNTVSTEYNQSQITSVNIV